MLQPRASLMLHAITDALSSPMDGSVPRQVPLAAQPPSHLTLLRAVASVAVLGCDQARENRESLAKMSQTTEERAWARRKMRTNMFDVRPLSN